MAQDIAVSVMKCFEKNDFSSMFDFLKSKYNEQEQKILTLHSENTHLQHQVLNLKKELKNYIATSINDRIMGKCSLSPGIQLDKTNEENTFQETFVDENEMLMNSAVVETFCSQIDKADFISIEDNKRKQNIEKSPIISRKIAKRRSQKTPPKKQNKMAAVKKMAEEYSSDVIPGTPEEEMVKKNKITKISFKTSPSRRKPFISIQNSPSKIFKFESSDDEFQMKTSPSKKSPSAGSSGYRKAKKKIFYNETTDESDTLLDELMMKSQKSPSDKKNVFTKPMNKNISPDNFPYVRDAVKKKSERRKLQGWACEDCRKYYKSAKLTDSEMQEKINACSKHRYNYNPFASNTPPGFWDPEFPPTQENNRTQTGDRITSK